MSRSSPIRSRKSRVIGSLTSSHNRHAPSNNQLDYNDIPSLMIPSISPNSQDSIIFQSSISGSPSKRKRQKSCCNYTLRHLLYKIKTSRLLLILFIVSILYSLGSTMFLMSRMDYISINNRGLRMFSYSRESLTTKSKHIKRRRHPQVIQYNDIYDLLTPSIIMYMDTKERLGSSDDREKRTIYISKKDLKEQERLLDSNDFSYRDPLYEGNCVPMQPWQETSFPNCNLVSLLCVSFTCISYVSSNNLYYS